MTAVIQLSTCLQSRHLQVVWTPLHTGPAGGGGSNSRYWDSSTQDSTFNAKWYAVDQIDQYGNTGLSTEWTHTAVQTPNNWMISAFKPEGTMVKQQCPRTRKACVQTLDYLIATRWRIDVSDQLWIQTTKFCTNLVRLSITKDVINPLKAVNGLYWQESRSFTENLIHGQC